MAAKTQITDRRMEDFDPLKKPKMNTYVMACITLASMTSVLLGYDIGVMSGASLYIKKEFNCTDVQIEVLIGILNLYSLLGSAAAGRTSDYFGRRKTIVLAGVIFFAGALLMGFATNYSFLMFGRFVAGVGVGFGLMIAPVYAAEVAPASSRGFLTSFPEVFINVGILLGYVSNYAFSKLPDHLGWRFMLAIAALPSMLIAISVLVMPESPRWLVLQGRLGDAKRVLVKTSDSDEEAAHRLADIKEATGIPQDCDDELVKVTKQKTGVSIFKDLLINPTPAVRHILITGLGIHFFEMATGVDAVVLYSPRTFEKAGITGSDQKLLATIAVGFVKTVFILVATFFLDRVGRRPLLLSSVAGVVVSLVSLGVWLTVIDHSHTKLTWAVVLCLASTLSYVAFFSIGIGPVTWVYSSEIFPLQLRAQGCAMGVGVNRFTSGVISMTFLSLSNAITTGGAFFLFAGITAAGWVFFFLLMPETQGKTLEEMSMLFGNYIGWRTKLKELEMKKKTAAVAVTGDADSKPTAGELQPGPKQG